MLFTDGSVHPPSGIGYGAYLAVTDQNALNPAVQLKRFEKTSSTRLEIQTLIWALGEIRSQTRTVTIYTDSQNIIGLPDRRKRLEQKAYCSKNKTPLKHANLYREFFNLIDQFDYSLVKVIGHRPSARKDAIDKLFTLADRASRRALRSDPRCI